MTTYMAGWNLSDYLPDRTDGPDTFDDFADAVAYLTDEAKHFWDEDKESAGLVHLQGSELAAVDQCWEPLLEALQRAGDGPDFTARTGDQKYEFWIHPLDAKAVG